MQAAIVVLVVGHRQWGKSRTIGAVSAKRGWVTLTGRRFFVRRMSNDDQPKGYEAFISALTPAKKPLVLMAYCPESGPPRFLRALAAKYKVCAFVLDHAFSGSRTISPAEIATLTQYATVSRFSSPRRPAPERAEALGRFIKRCLAAPAA